MKNRIDVFLQYYKPHVSGLTNMAAELAEHAVSNGFVVHVHCVSLGPKSSYLNINGVHVHNYKKSFSIARASFSFSLLGAMWKMRNSGNIAHVHMPYPEAFVLAKIFSKDWRFVTTYQCDAPKGSFTQTLIARLLDWSHKSLIRRSSKTVVSSVDYGRNSRLSEIIQDNNPSVIPVTYVDRSGGQPKFRIDGKTLVGFMGRPTHEKGINVLLNAINLIPDKTIVLLFAGPLDGVREKGGYDVNLANQLASSGKMVQLGFLEEDDIRDFFASLDVYAFPSINSFEAFGIVQLEAISAGVPVVASDLPGVRTVVRTTNFGEITRVGSEKDLARGIQKALTSKYNFTQSTDILNRIYLYPVPHNNYLEIFKELSKPAEPRGSFH